MAAPEKKDGPGFAVAIVGTVLVAQLVGLRLAQALRGSGPEAK
jgi:hypothetical protein